MFGLTRAPDLDRAGLHWFNVDAPLSLDDLRGRIVILDFWTFCCINCMHVLPTLRRVEERYPEHVVVIGVHSPKFKAERDSENVRRAIARYDVRHPVVHDPYMSLWDEYAVRAWPTLVVISPDGYVIGQLSGEPDPDRLVEGIGEMIREFSDRGEIQPRPLPVSLAVPEKAPSRLSFPGKIKPLAEPWEGAAWAVADAGHHQIVLLSDDGEEIRRFGSGRPGFDDGGDGSFDGPQGLTCDAGAIYVADTGNHALRRIDLTDGSITTLAGVGGRGLPLGRPMQGHAAPLASPWDVALDGPDHLYFANAGSHQIGLLDLSRGLVVPVAGSGGENIVDGPAREALLAQPSGLALDAAERVLYFADSETSSIRLLRLDGAGTVESLVGKGLFAFGADDGPFESARLQHALGVARLDGERLVVADSYNAAIRLLDLTARRVTTLGSDLVCLDDVCLPLAEPAGVWAASPERLLIADTNNHRIVEWDLRAKTTRTFFG